MQNVEALERALNRANIFTDRWYPPNRTVTDLCEELERGECELDLEARTRTIRTLSLDIYGRNDGSMYRLFESKQLTNSGKIVRRRNKSAVSERLFKTEQPDEASIRRALREELGLETFHKHCLVAVTSHQHSGGYPNLVTHNTLHHYRVSIRDIDFNPAGYWERTKDRIIFFTWKRYRTNDSTANYKPSPYW